METIAVCLVHVKRTSTRGVTTMGRVCVALDGLETIAPKVVSIMLKSEDFFSLGLIIFITFNFPQVFCKVTNMKFIYRHPYVKRCL